MLIVNLQQIIYCITFNQSKLVEICNLLNLEIHKVVFLGLQM